MSYLFEVTFMVDHKRFGEVLASLDGKVYNIKHRLIRREGPPAEGDQLSLPAPDIFMSKQERARALIDRLKKDGVTVVKTKQVAELIEADGNYTSTLMTQLVKEKLVKRVKQGVYELKKGAA